MTSNMSILTKRYATAFLNIFFSKISSQDFTQLQALSTYLDTHQEGLFYLKLSCIKQEIKQEVLLKLFAKFDLASQPYKRLLMLLAHDHRLSLIAIIIKHIIILYKERMGIVDVIVASSHALNTAYQQELEQTLKKAFKKTILYHYKLEPSLIAGIRLSTTTCLWEYSIQQQLDRLKHSESGYGT